MLPGNALFIQRQVELPSALLLLINNSACDDKNEAVGVAEGSWI